MPGIGVGNRVPSTIGPVANKVDVPTNLLMREVCFSIFWLSNSEAMNDSPLNQHWHEVRGDASMPLYKHFDQSQIVAILPDLLVFKVKQSQLDFEYSLIGQRVRRLIPANRVGLRLRELPGKGPESKLWAHLKSAIDTQAPVLFMAPYEGPVSEIEVVKTLITPWADHDGDVDRLVMHIADEPLTHAAKSARL